MPDKRGTFFGICCTAQLQSKVIDEFLQTTYKYSKECMPMLVLVDDLEGKHSKPTHPPTDALSFPFNGKGGDECFHMLQKHVQDTESNINYEYFAMLDEQSATDSTVLLAVGSRRKQTVQSVRAVFEVANIMLSSLSVGSGSMGEMQEQANEEEDGVFRIHPLNPNRTPKTAN